MEFAGALAGNPEPSLNLPPKQVIAKQQESLSLKWGSDFYYLFLRMDGFNLTFKRTEILEQKMDLN